MSTTRKKAGLIHAQLAGLESNIAERDSKMSQENDNEKADDSDQAPNKKQSPVITRLRKRKRSSSEGTANSKDRMVRLKTAFKGGESRDHPINVDEYLLTLETEKIFLVSSPSSALLSLTFSGSSPT
jgi:hypothetical protein